MFEMLKGITFLVRMFLSGTVLELHSETNRLKVLDLSFKSSRLRKVEKELDDVMNLFSETSSSEEFARAAKLISDIYEQREEINKDFKAYYKQAASRACYKSKRSLFKEADRLSKLSHAQQLKDLTRAWLESIQYHKGGSGKVTLYDRQYSIDQCLDIINKTRACPSVRRLRWFLRLNLKERLEALPALEEVTPYLPEGNILQFALQKKQEILEDNPPFYNEVVTSSRRL